MVAEGCIIRGLDLRIQITQASDLGSSGITLGGLATEVGTTSSLVGLSVSEQEPPNRTVSTNLDGRFVFDGLRPDQTLMFSLVGYRILSVSVNELIDSREVTTRGR